MAASAAFDTTVTASGNNTGIVVPDNLIERLGAGHRPAVVVTVNGYQYRSTVAVMGGKHMISISAAVRKQTGLTGGDPIHVTLTLADTPREIGVPDDFAAALAADAERGPSSPASPTVSSATTSTTSMGQKPPRRGSGASRRRSHCSARERSGEQGRKLMPR